MIEVNNLTKTYGKKNNKFTALQNVNFQIPGGASVAIIGKSGSGKSTLMHAMSGLDRPEIGEVVVDGRNILKLSTKEIDQFRATKMGFVFQSFFVEPNDSCYDNVSLPLEIAELGGSARRKRINAALAKVELSEKSKSRARDLSGGQKQRLAIARAIVNGPKILFADEPTGNLDTVTGNVIVDMLFDMNAKHGVTLIIVTHDEDLAAKCDMQIHIVDGEVAKITTSAKGAN